MNIYKTIQLFVILIGILFPFILKLKINGKFFYSTFSNKYVRHWLPTNMEFSSNWRRMYFPVTETEKEKEKDYFQLSRLAKLAYRFPTNFSHRIGRNYRFWKFSRFQNFLAVDSLLRPEKWWWSTVQSLFKFNNQVTKMQICARRCNKSEEKKIVAIVNNHVNQIIDADSFTLFRQPLKII